MHLQINLKQKVKITLHKCTFKSLELDRTISFPSQPSFLATPIRLKRVRPKQESLIADEYIHFMYSVCKLPLINGSIFYHTLMEA